MKVGLKLKHLKIFVSYTQLFTSQDITDGLKTGLEVVGNCDAWILILTAPIHCRGYVDEQVMQCCSDEDIFIFGVNYAFKTLDIGVPSCVGKLLKWNVLNFFPSLVPLTSQIKKMLPELNAQEPSWQHEGHVLHIHGYIHQLSYSHWDEWEW